MKQEGRSVLQEGWLTTEQAVELSGYHVEYLRELLRKGAIEAVKLTPRVWLVNRESLEDYKQTVQMGRPRDWAKAVDDYYTDGVDTLVEKIITAVVQWYAEGKTPGQIVRELEAGALFSVRIDKQAVRTIIKQNQHWEQKREQDSDE